MDNDTYIKTIVGQHTPVIGYDASQKVQGLLPHILAWSNGHKYNLLLHGSFAKGTAITGTTDIDLFISLDPSVSSCNTLENVYTTLRNRLNGAGYTAREQNVSLGIQHESLKIDVVPGVLHDNAGTDHSLWRRKAKTWTKTNVDHHVRHISGSGKTEDIKAIKIWRKLRGLDFPSFYLELSVLEALKNHPAGNPAVNFAQAITYLSDEFINRRIVDPANQNNVVSDDLTEEEKKKIRDAAKLTLTQSWPQAIW